MGAGNGIGSNHKIEATSSGSHFYLSLTLIRKLFLVVQSEGIKKYLGHEATITVGKRRLNLTGAGKEHLDGSSWEDSRRLV